LFLGKTIIIVKILNIQTAFSNFRCQLNHACLCNQNCVWMLNKEEKISRKWRSNV